MEELGQVLRNYIHLSDKDWTVIQEYFHPLSIKKDHVLTNQNSVEERLYFITDGIVRLYYEGEEKDITLNFGFPNSFINCYTSFLTQTESKYILQSLSACELVYISRKDLETLYEITDCGHHLGRLFAENLFLYLSKREDSFVLNTPTERYLNLFEEQRHLIQQIPLKYIASYIGITPQALSRIRAKL